MKTQATWLVVGAGPGGLAVVGTLLSSGISEDQVYWVDPTFSSGNLRNVSEVPSNTKVSLFTKFFTACPYLHDRMKEVVAEDPQNNPFTGMARLDQNLGCSLSHPAAAVESTTRMILRRVKHSKSTVVRMESEGGRWTVTLADQDTVVVSHVALCTGSVARELNLHADYPNLQMIPLQEGFQPSRLRELITDKDTVAVLGTSHSGVLLLRNLCTVLPEEHNIKVSSVQCVSKKKLLYAEYMEDGWIKNDNTGLKLTAADWAREYYDKADHPLLKKIPLGENEQAVYKEVFPKCTKIMYAVGYDRVALPTIVHNGKERTATYDNKNGKLLDVDGETLPGLYGFGIAFPENKKYPNGASELAVGMWKFMDYASRVVPTWTRKIEPSAAI